MNFQAIAILSSCAMAMLFPASANAAGTCPTGSTAQQPVKLGPLSVARCHTDYTTDEKAAFKSVGSYYGRVLMTVDSGVDMEIDKSFAKALAAFFGVKEEFTAVVTVSVYVTIAGENVLVYEKPVYSISRDNKGKTKLSANILGGNAMSVSPNFVLDGTNGEVHTQLKVALVNSRKLDVLPLLKEGVNLAQLMGGPTTLVTTIGEPAFLAVASRVQSSYEAAFSDEESTDLDTVLKFERNDGLRGVEYRVSFPVPKGQPSTVKVKLSLATQESLLTPESAFREDEAGAKWPDASKIPVSRWAEKILLSTRTVPGVTVSSLATSLDQQGVPQKLEGLILTDNTADQVTRKEAVNKSCTALNLALQKTPYRLTEADAQLILFNELSQGRVFERYSPASLSCTAAMVPIWKARYNLQAPSLPGIAERTIPWKAKEARLNRMAKSWDMPTPELRSFTLSDDFAPHDVHMTAPTGFIPGVVVSEQVSGFQQFDAAVRYLAVRRKACFGNFKPTADKDPTATGFVRFEDDPMLYLVVFRFDNQAEFVVDPGPRVAGLGIRPASEDDKVTYNQSGSCL
jgi:hypothetical protein